MFKSLLEPFAVSPAEANSQEDLRYYYGDKRPNAVLSGKDRDIPLAGPTTTYMGTLLDETVANYAGQSGPNRRENSLEDKWLMPNNAMTKDLLSARQAACESLGRASDQFAHLSDMAANVDPKSRIRCGWIYNASDPFQGRGAYGTIDGPVVDSTATGTWMWDLQAAKKKFHIAICSTGKNCADVDNNKYKGRCGFCKSSKKLIPINGSVAAYPYDGNNACNATNVVVTSGSCPKPKPPPPAGSPAAKVWEATRSVCDPLNNGSLARECLVQTATQAGCSEKGTLIAALKSGSDTNYIDTLSQASSYSLYQQRAAVGFNETALKTGKMTVSDALTEFQGLQDNASSAANKGLQAAATDLCFTKGSYEDFDFCTELLPTSKAPFSLDCLQKAFLRAGGQQTGTLYPQMKSMKKWNSYNTWNDVNNAIDSLKTSTLSSDRAAQQRAIEQFYGIPLEDRSAPMLGNIPNVEIFWFSPDTNIKGSTTYNTTFLGRRIRSQIPYLSGSSGLPAGLGAGSFVFFTNMVVNAPMSFNIRFNGDSGFIFAMNKPMTDDYKTYDAAGYGNGQDVANKELSSLYPTYSNPQTEMRTGSPWTIQPNTPNVLTGYYMGNGTNFKINYMLVSSAPPDCGCYGYASGDLRLYKQDECEKGLNGNWYGNGECLKKTGGSWSAQCGPLNTQNPCANQYNFFPGNMLYLTQDPYAPMISFNVRQNYQIYNCDYPLCDKRLSSHKMKFTINGGSGPTPTYVGKSKDTEMFPLGKSYMTFNQGSGIRSQFQLPMYSFMTMIFIIRFNTVPPSGSQTTPVIFWAGYPSIDYPTILLVGQGNNTAQLSVGSLLNLTGANATSNAYGCTSPPKTKDGPIITAGKTYVITLKALRKSEGDLTSLYALQVGAATLSDLQNDISSLKETSPLAWNPPSLARAGLANSMYIVGEANSQFDLFSMQLFDYVVTGENLKHVVNDDWPVPATNVYS